MTVPSNGIDVAETVGVIIPPPDVREILETTAAFVAKNPAFEARVLQEHQNDPRFCFLNSSDPYHAYYRSKVDEGKHVAGGDAKSKEGAHVSAHGIDGKGFLDHGESLKDSPGNAKRIDIQQSTAEDAANGKTTTKGKAAVSFLKSVQAKEEAARPEPREPPSDDLFTISNVNPAPDMLGLDVMKLAAQFVARHGPNFLMALASKEGRNSLFDFLKPLHPHFIVFQRLVDAYKIILDTGEQKEQLLSKITDQAENEQSILNEVWYLHDWECQRAEREHEAAMDESQKLKVAQIDWHDFVVLETVDIDDDEVDLPAPVTDAKQLPKILAAAQKAELEREKNRRDVDMELDQGPDPVPPSVSSMPARSGAVVTVDVGSDIPTDRIRKQPSAVASRVAKDAEATTVLPSGERVPLSKVDESMRALLLDPSYKDERARAAEKNRLQNLAGGDEIARNLERWDRARAEAGVYNRADLQTALSGLPKPPVEEADRMVGKAAQSGPKLPGEVEEKLSPPAKRARVEAAVGVLSKGGGAGKEGGSELAVTDAVADGEADEERVPGMIGAKEWLQQTGGTAVVRVRMPVHGNREWKLEGQEMEISAKLRSNVGKLKGVLAKLTKLPVNKQKLLLVGVGFLRDGLSFAHYNVKDGDVIALEVKERGGRKKHG